MFTFSPYPDLHQPKAPRLVIGGYGKTFYINKDSSPFLEIETGPNSWNPFNAECFFQHYFCIGNGDKAYFVDLYTKEIKTFSCDIQTPGCPASALTANSFGKPKKLH